MPKLSLVPASLIATVRSQNGFKRYDAEVAGAEAMVAAGVPAVVVSGLALTSIDVSFDAKSFAVTLHVGRERSIPGHAATQEEAFEKAMVGTRDLNKKMGMRRMAEIKNLDAAIVAWGAGE